MNGHPLKVALVGPPEAGKTRLANHLAHEPVTGATDYDPTKGCRILVFERDVTDAAGARRRVQVELWDVSGDDQCDACWPAVTVGLDALAVVFDPSSKAQAAVVKSVGKYFVGAAGLGEGQTAVFAHGNLTAQHKPLNIAGRGGARVPAPIFNVNLRAVGADGTGRTSVDDAFDALLASASAARDALGAM